MTRSALHLAVGIASRTGRRPDNQDYVASYVGTPAERITHGTVAMVADGLGGAKGGRIAAELACRSFLDAYYALSPTLGVAVAADRALSGYNRWLNGMALTDPVMTGAGCTFSAVIIRGREAHSLHVGDSRIWLFRDGRLALLTSDHCLQHPEQSHILYRAIGLELTVRLDHGVHGLEAHDRLLLTSDGVHGVITAQAIEAILVLRGEPGQDAGAIVEMAISAGSDDNASAVIVDVVALPDPDQASIVALAAALAVESLPVAGASIDGFCLERRLSNGEQTSSFVASTADGSRYVLKFPDPSVMSDQEARAAFARETMIGTRAISPYLAEIVRLPRDVQSRVYTVMPLYEGETLERRLRAGPMPYAEGLDLAAKVARGVMVLHRLGIVHRDIKPDNIFIEHAGGVRLIDFGLARLPGLEQPPLGAVPGSHGYLAPELYLGARGDGASDQFALGVTLYRIFTGHFPFADLQSLRRPGTGSPADPAALRPDMPAWLAGTLRRAVQLRPQDRFGDVIELLHMLERGSADAAPRPPTLPLAQRNPVLLWKLVAGALFIALAISLLVGSLR